MKVKMMNYQKRLQHLQTWLATKATECDALLITNKSNIRYLSGFTGTFAFLVISKERAFILTDSRYTLQAKQQSGHFELVTLARYTPPMSIANLCHQSGWETLGFERDDLSFSFYEKLVQCFGRANLFATDHAVEQLRAIKDADEIALLKEAEAIGDRAFTHILDFIVPGMTEKEVAFELEMFMRKQGASALSFDTIVASGHRSAMPHGVASDKVIEKGDLVVMDYGCIYEGYCSDMTRTIGIGSLSEAQKELYDLVYKAQTEALKKIKAGVIGEDMQSFVQQLFDEAGYGDYFGHGLGHSVGLDIHEEPRFSRNVKQGIPAGTVISVEPGLYVPDIGGVRIEDLIAVTEDGYDNLATSPKNLLII